MQLKKYTSKLKPVSLMITGLVATTNMFMYYDIDNISNKLTNNNTCQYVTKINTKENEYIALKLKFQEYLKRWKEKTMFMSSAISITNDEDFKKIVSMGQYAVPFILEEISDKPSTLVWALNFIYGRKISNNKSLTITEACKQWTKKLS